MLCRCGAVKLLYCWHCAGVVVDSSLVSAASGFGCLDNSEFWITFGQVDSPTVGAVLCRARYILLHMARREILPDWHVATLLIDHGWGIVERHIQNQEAPDAKTLCIGSVLKCGV